MLEKHFITANVGDSRIYLVEPEGPMTQSPTDGFSGLLAATDISGCLRKADPKLACDELLALVHGPEAATI